MTQHLDFLPQTPLFAGITPEDLPSLLGCLKGKWARFARGETIFLAGDRAALVGVVCTGCVQVEREDYFGNRSILSRLFPGDLFGESFACAGTEALPVSVVAQQESNILLFDYRRAIITCASICAFHTKLIENMLAILASKNITLAQKNEILSCRSMRDKLMLYLSGQAKMADSNCFSIPFNRQELADFLCVDRSALSSELGRMQREGILRFEKNMFELL